MEHTPLTILQLRDLINKGEISDPIVFLESIMGGQDPRRMSSIYELIMEIDAFSNGDLSSGDWSEIVDHVSDRYKYYSVPLSDSIAASKTLAEYLHPKRKQIEINGNSDSNSLVKSSPLTEEEIELFKEKFNDDF